MIFIKICIGLAPPLKKVKRRTENLDLDYTYCSLALSIDLMKAPNLVGLLRRPYSDKAKYGCKILAKSLPLEKFVPSWRETGKLLPMNIFKSQSQNSKNRTSKVELRKVELRKVELRKSRTSKSRTSKSRRFVYKFEHFCIQFDITVVYNLT